MRPRILSHKGDLINGYEATASEREPDPARLLEGYNHAVATLNEKSEQWAGYWEIVDHILDAIAFMESLGGADPRMEMAFLGRVPAAA
ncbi:MAG: 3-deoxy-7-phosphoheptulonate synthase [Thermoleophilia bacterium]|nr:3-deoxy-7-phosphoheptulonate synthase [Thermoleophilia bacterium]